MKLHRIDHIGIIVNDLEAAKAFFQDLGMEVQGGGEFEGEWVGKIVGLGHVKDAFVFMQTPDGGASIELIKYHTPVDEKGVQQNFSNTLGIRHIAFIVEDIDAMVAKLKKSGAVPLGDVFRYEDSYKLCHLRGPENIIIELAEELK